MSKWVNLECAFHCSTTRHGHSPIWCSQNISIWWFGGRDLHAVALRFWNSKVRIKGLVSKEELVWTQKIFKIWNHKFHEFLTKFDLHPIDIDPCVYSIQQRPLLIATIFVDNGPGCCVHTPKLIINKMVSHMEKSFEVSKSTKDVYVGLYNSWNRPCKLLSTYLTCRFFVHYVLVSTLTNPNIWLDDLQVEEPNHTFPYIAIVRSL